MDAYTIRKAEVEQQKARIEALWKSKGNNIPLMELKLQKDRMEALFRFKGNKIPLVPRSPKLRTDYLATDSIYVEALTPIVVYIFRRYVNYVVPPTPAMSRRVQEANTSYVDLHIMLTAPLPLSERSLNWVKEQVMNDSYESLLEACFKIDRVEYQTQGMESHLYYLRSTRFKNHTKDRIAALKKVLNQEIVISKLQPKYPD